MPIFKPAKWFNDLLQSKLDRLPHTTRAVISYFVSHDSEDDGVQNILLFQANPAATGPGVETFPPNNLCLVSHTGSHSRGSSVNVRDGTECGPVRWHIMQDDMGRDVTICVTDTGSVRQRRGRTWNV